jgi:hypothetical protein
MPDNSICAGKCNTILTNNCGQSLQCAACATGDVCLANNTCCHPSGCGGPCVDNCGQQNSSCCPPPPPDSGCTPSGCGGPCVDNCGNQNSSCCPPPDSGGPPHDGGSCGPPGAQCSPPCCPGLLCGYNFTCVTSCNGPGMPCNSNLDCCYSHSCSGVAPAGPASAASAQPAIPLPDSGVSIGTCQ